MVTSQSARIKGGTSDNAFQEQWKRGASVGGDLDLFNLLLHAKDSIVNTILALTNNHYFFISEICSKKNSLAKLCIGANGVRNNRSLNLYGHE